MDGAEIRAAREARGWTQGELAEELGVSMRTVGNWERGETVPRNRLGMLERVLARDIDADQNRAAADRAVEVDDLGGAAAAIRAMLDLAAQAGWTEQGHFYIQSAKIILDRLANRMDMMVSSGWIKPDSPYVPHPAPNWLLDPPTPLAPPTSSWRSNVDLADEQRRAAASEHRRKLLAAGWPANRPIPEVPSLAHPRPDGGPTLLGEAAATVGTPPERTEFEKEQAAAELGDEPGSESDDDPGVVPDDDEPR